MLQRYAQQLEFMSIDDCIRMVCKDSELKFSEKEVRVVFALSKQSARQDCTEQGIHVVLRLPQV